MRNQLMALLVYQMVKHNMALSFDIILDVCSIVFFFRKLPIINLLITKFVLKIVIRHVDKKLTRQEIWNMVSCFDESDQTDCVDKNFLENVFQVRK